MKVFKDIFSGDELLSDSYEIKEIADGCVYEVVAKMVTKTDGDIDIGAADEEFTSDSVTVIDVIDAHRLVETGMNKKGYMTHIKGYMGALVAKLPEDRQVPFKTGVSKFIKEVVLKKFSEFQFYTGESMDPDNMLILVKWEGENPHMFFFRDGLVEEKY